MSVYSVTALGLFALVALALFAGSAVYASACALARHLAAPVLALVLLSGGCVPVEAINQAATEAAICHGHATDPALPVEARMIGESERAAWAAQYRSLTGEDVPGSETWGAQ